METPPEGADIMGGHLEGPFINPDKLGAQPNHAIRASRALISRLQAQALRSALSRLRRNLQKILILFPG